MKRVSRALALLLCAVLVLSSAASTTAAVQGLSFKLKGKAAVGETIRIVADAQGYEQPEFDYLVRKPGAEKYVYIKRGTAEGSCEYTLEEPGKTSVKVKVREAGGGDGDEILIRSFTVEESGGALYVKPALPELPEYTPKGGVITTGKDFVRVFSLAAANFKDGFTLKVKDALKVWESHREEKSNININVAFMDWGRYTIYYGTAKGVTTVEITYGLDEAGQVLHKHLFGTPYSYTSTVTRERVSFVEQTARKIIESTVTEDMSDYEKAEALYAYLLTHYRYAFHYADGDSSNTGVNNTAESYSAYGMFKNGYAVCEGYAEAYSLLLNLVGITSTTITGFAGENHMWNLVKLDGTWYHADPTWDDPVPDVPGRAQYHYFLKSDKTMAKDHTWDTLINPVCAADYPQ